MNIYNSLIYKVYIIINISEVFDEEVFFKNINIILRSGIKLIQLRYKYDDYDFFKYVALKLKKKCDEYQVKLIINDNLNIMYETNASGIHLGQNDIINVDYDKLKFYKKIIGISSQTLSQALIAKKNGAHYLGVGAIFKSNTKKNSNIIGINRLKEITYNIDIPVVAIGGINFDNINQLINTKIAGIAIISLIENSNNKNLILKKLLLHVNKIIGN